MSNENNSNNSIIGSLVSFIITFIVVTLIFTTIKMMTYSIVKILNPKATNDQADYWGELVATLVITMPLVVVLLIWMFS
jgi:hypothetical protein